MPKEIESELTLGFSSQTADILPSDGWHGLQESTADSQALDPRAAAGLPPRTRQRATHTPEEEDWTLVDRLIPRDVEAHVRRYIQAAGKEGAQRALGTRDLLSDVLRQLGELTPPWGPLNDGNILAEYEHAKQLLACDPLAGERTVKAEAAAAENALARYWVDGLLVALRLTNDRSVQIDDSFRPIARAPKLLELQTERDAAILATVPLSADSLRELGAAFCADVKQELTKHPDRRSVVFPHSVLVEMGPGGSLQAINSDQDRGSTADPFDDECYCTTA